MLLLVAVVQTKSLRLRYNWNMKISNIKARQILDSRGNPTIEADVLLENGTLGRASVPSGASTGTHEALELRDGGTEYNGKGVMKAVGNVNEKIRDALIGKDPSDQAAIDKLMLEIDGTENKSNLGANAILSVSLAVAKAAAIAMQKPLFAHIAELSGSKNIKLPMPMMNIINGGKHASGSTDIQEFMIVPVGANRFSESLRCGVEIFHALGKKLAEGGYTTTVGDEGGYAPAVRNGNTEALDLICSAIEAAGYKVGEDVVFALDVASSELMQNDTYHLATENRMLSSADMTSWYEELSNRYPLFSIEDGLGEEDWDGWVQLTERLGDKIQLVGDDLFVTNPKFIQKGIDKRAANAVLIKLNQIGSLSETIDAVKLAQSNGYKTIVSHRSGETEDTTIAHLAVGLGTGQIKTGSLSRSERTAKYNELLRIEEHMRA